MNRKVGTKVRLIKRQFFGDRTFAAGTIAEIVGVRQTANAYRIRFRSEGRTRQISANNVIACGFLGAPAKTSLALVSGGIDIDREAPAPRKIAFGLFGDETTHVPPPKGPRPSSKSGKDFISWPEDQTSTRDQEEPEA
jgi:hypothetical protein